MHRATRSLIAMALLVWTMLLATTGCSLFQSQQQPQKPLTVQDWMAQPRVKPQP